MENKLTIEKQWRVILADDHEILRDGIAALIDKQPDMSVIASADTGRRAVELTLEMKPDVVVMDIAMPELNGIDATSRICSIAPLAKVVCLSMHKDARMIAAMLRAGAAGYLVKECAGDELVGAIRAVVKGKAYLSPMIADEIVQGYLSNSPTIDSGVFDILSAREREVLQLIAEGKNTKEIGGTLGISEKTVAAHRLKLMERLECQSVADLTRCAIRQGLIIP